MLAAEGNSGISIASCHPTPEGALVAPQGGSLLIPSAKSDLFQFYSFLQADPYIIAKLTSHGTGNYFKLSRLLPKFYTLECFLLMMVHIPNKKKKATKMI